MSFIIKAFLLFLTFPFILQSQSRDIKFDNFTVENGLSGNFVNHITQDSKGFMWFCTRNGLNRYDGYSFKIYRHDPDNPESLSHMHTAYIYEDTYGALWVATNGGGLDKFD